MTTVGSRIEALLRDLHVSALQFSKVVGINNKSVGAYIKDKVEVTPRAINFICMAYPDLNRAWLEKGQGDMWKGGKNGSSARVVPASVGRRVVTTAIPPVERNEKPVLSDSDIMCPYYDVDFACGFPFFENDQTEFPARFIVSPVNRKDMTVWCNATGRSMEPTIMSGDAVALEKVEDPSRIIFGEIYAIVTDSYRTIKRICKGSDNESWTLVSDNENKKLYADQEIKFSEVIHVYRVTGSMHKF